MNYKKVFYIYLVSYWHIPHYSYYISCQFWNKCMSYYVVFGSFRFFISILRSCLQTSLRQKCIVYTRAIPPLIDATYCSSISKPLLFHLSPTSYSNVRLLYFNTVADIGRTTCRDFSTLLRKLLRCY